MPATGDGDTAAAFSLDEALEYAKRYNAQTFVFGEILGAKEASTAVSAFQGGKGTSSTIHAKSTKGAISALSRFLTEAGSFSDNLVPQQEILDSISFIIQISTIPQQNGSLKRVVTQVAQLIPSDTGLGRVKAIPKILFEWDRHAGVHIAKEPPLPEIQRELLDAGLREDFFEEWVA
jgi:Flp pilus assembly CpaF family ATPase